MKEGKYQSEIPRRKVNIKVKYHGDVKKSMNRKVKNKKPPLSFCLAFFDHALDHLMQWATFGSKRFHFNTQIIHFKNGLITAGSK